MKYDRYDIPLIFALESYARKNSLRFHMPGHKGRRIPDTGAKILQKNLYRWDVTEIPGLDNLHAPRGAIKRSQRLLARLYGADRSFFLVNGSTSGVIAMITAAVKPGQKLIVSRATHKSLLWGLIISGALPVYVMPELNKELGVYTQVTPNRVEERINSHSDAGAVLLTNPTYQGFCPDLREISDLAKKKGLSVLVDEAHGPHLGFSPALPSSAGELGADAWVQSPHKILTSLTQTAWLHMKGSKLKADELAEAVSLVTSTSPSYILMASMELARLVMEKKGKELVENCLETASYARYRINLKTPFSCVGKEMRQRNGIYDIDLSRLMVNVSQAGYSGFEVETILRQNFNIYAEYADFCNVYFLVGFAHTKKHMNKLVRALAAFKPKKRSFAFPLLPEELPAKHLKPRDAFLAEGEYLPINEARGRILKRALVPYPPGIALAMPGELLESCHIKWAASFIKAGGELQGLGAGNRVWVVKE